MAFKVSTILKAHFVPLSLKTYTVQHRTIICSQLWMMIIYPIVFCQIFLGAFII